MYARAQMTRQITNSISDHQPQNHPWHLSIFPAAVVFTSSLFTATACVLAQSQVHSITAPLVNFNTGQVTAPKSGTTVEINDRLFTTKRQVVIHDDEGRPRDEKDLRLGSEIKFHMKDGEIDEIIIILPK